MVISTETGLWSWAIIATAVAIFALIHAVRGDLKDVAWQVVLWVVAFVKKDLEAVKPEDLWPIADEMYRHLPAWVKPIVGSKENWRLYVWYAFEWWRSKVLAAKQRGAVGVTGAAKILGVGDKSWLVWKVRKPESL
jgi:hypothetical protein